ncbi:ATP-binding protein [Actinomadura chokoriensis]|uniref:ATP-binding protein n=1 Tax=Actinomadura chokoriensis TaxID=454156 RepID=A0ABV4QVV5_9ACTN
MTTPPGDELSIASNEDVVHVRQVVRAAAAAAGMSLVDQTKIVTAASELARNAFVYGGGGTARVESAVNARGRPGVRLVFADAGPGIPDVEQALTEGWTTGGGLGLGLPGTRRLVDEFELDTAVGEGTTITVTKWTR